MFVMVDDHVKRKILLLGDGAVGKTSLIRRFVVDKFPDEYITTIGTKVTKKGETKYRECVCQGRWRPAEIRRDANSGKHVLAHIRFSS